MIEKMFPHIYRIEIPLPNNPLKTLNSYFIQGKERNLLIDTGFNQPECRAAIEQGLQELGISMEHTDIFVTHVHSDHSGLVGYLVTPKSNVYCGPYSAQALQGGQNQMWGYFRDMIEQSGLKEVALTDHPGYRFASDQVQNVHILQDGYVIRVGDYNFQCIETAGHAPDHFCLYEPEQKILFSGDHILGKITPNNTLWGAPWTVTQDLLGEYLKNLDKIASLEIKITFPAHREIIDNCYHRINELKNHHQERLNDILTLLGHERMNGAQVASKMKWDLRNRTWDDFPPAQKLFATGEALSHLTHLVTQRVLVKELKDGVVYYSRTTPSI